MIYISGKMTGIKDYNYPEFNRVAKGFSDKGYKVFNPAEINIDTSEMSEIEKWMAYMEVCIPAIDKCKTIYLLKGWQKSKGAKLELKRAIEQNLIIKIQGIKN